MLVYLEPTLIISPTPTLMVGYIERVLFVRHATILQVAERRRVKGGSVWLFTTRDIPIGESGDFPTVIQCAPITTTTTSTATRSQSKEWGGLHLLHGPPQFMLLTWLKVRRWGATIKRPSERYKREHEGYSWILRRQSVK